MAIAAISEGQRLPTARCIFVFAAIADRPERNGARTVDGALTTGRTTTRTPTSSWRARSSTRWTRTGTCRSARSATVVTTARIIEPSPAEPSIAGRGGHCTSCKTEPDPRACRLVTRGSRSRRSSPAGRNPRNRAAGCRPRRVRGSRPAGGRSRRRGREPGAGRRDGSGTSAGPAGHASRTAAAPDNPEPSRRGAGRTRVSPSRCGRRWAPAGASGACSPRRAWPASASRRS